MSQTTYAIEAARAFEGMLGDTSGGPTRKSLSLANEEASATPFGRGVKGGTDPDTQFLLPTATGQTLRGITVHKHGTEDVTNDGLSTDEVGEVLNSGRIWVTPEQAVTPDDPVYWRHTAGGAGEVPGRFRKDADTAKADQVTEAVWRTSAAADDPALLEINLP